MGGLYEGWGGPRVALPDWVIRAGLVKYKPLLQRIYATAANWQQAEADGIGQVAPMLVYFGGSVQDSKAQAGAHWKSIHHAKITTNIDRLFLLMVGGWRLDEAMLWPAASYRRSKTLLKGHTRQTLIAACRLCSNGKDLRDWIITCTDIDRMKGIVDPSWGRKRVKREHDALVIKTIMERSDPTPWAKPWHLDIGPFTFSLICSETDLALEGATQKHCAKSYAKDCRNGDEIVMRILGPERATCSWRPGQPDIQVKAFANREVGAECYRAAREARLAFESTMRAAQRGE